MEALVERRYSSYSFTTSALDEGEWSASRPGRDLPPAKRPRYPLYSRLGGPQSRSGHRLEEKSSVPAGDRTPIFQSVARHYTDWATLTLYRFRVPADTHFRTCNNGTNKNKAQKGNSKSQLETWAFIAVFMRTNPRNLSKPAEWNSRLHNPFYIWMLSSHRCLRPPRGLFALSFPSKICFPSNCSTRSAHLIVNIIIGRNYVKSTSF
jgi:hypothetical protein